MPSPSHPKRILIKLGLIINKTIDATKDNKRKWNRVQYLSKFMYEVLNVKTLIEISNTLIKKINLQKSNKIMKLNSFSKKFINAKSSTIEKFRINDLKKKIAMNTKNMLAIIKDTILFIIYMF